MVTKAFPLVSFSGGALTSPGMIAWYFSVTRLWTVVTKKRRQIKKQFGINYCNPNSVLVF